MAFPHHDPAWCSAADFLRAQRRSGESILGPDAFVFLFDRIHRYANTSMRPDQRYDWAALHVGMLHEISPGFLADLAREMRPVYANDVFAVWARGGTARRLSAFDGRLRRFRRAVREHGRVPPPAPRPAFDVPDAGVLEEFARLSRPEIKAAMDRLFVRGGYRSPTARDVAYMAEMDRCLADLMGEVAGKRILDLACGDGRGARMSSGCAAYVGVDLAEVPLRELAAQWRDRPGFHVATMAAEQLALPSAAFDLIVCVEAIEHVMDVEATLAEVARVTNPGGRFVVSCQNSASLHLVVNRKLGYPNFFTSYQHLREFTPAELGALLARHGFTVEASRGIWFSPYWEVPGIDPHTRKATDDDPELVEIMRVLGQRVGPDHAHTFMLAARKN